MVKCRLKGPTGNTVIFLGLTPEDMAKTLMSGPILVDGEELGLGANTMIAIVGGANPQSIIRELEENMHVKFPRDEKTGLYIQVNS